MSCGCGNVPCRHIVITNNNNCGDDTVTVNQSLIGTVEVTAVGPGYTAMGGTFIPTQHQVGDVVVLPTMGFTKFEYEGTEYWVGKENEVLAKIVKENE